jgi:hypothetical protein
MQALQIQTVVKRALISSAATLMNKTRLAKLPQVVGHQIEWLLHLRHKFSNAVITLCKLLEQPPPQIMRQQLEHRWRWLFYHLHPRFPPISFEAIHFKGNIPECD